MLIATITMLMGPLCVQFFGSGTDLYLIRLRFCGFVVGGWMGMRRTLNLRFGMCCDWGNTHAHLPRVVMRGLINVAPLGLADGLLRLSKNCIGPS